MPLLEILVAKETQVWEALVHGDMVADYNSLHADFLGVYPSGFAGRQDHVDQLKGGASIAAYEISQARLLMLSPICHCLSYLARFRRPDSKVEEAMYVSSIWQRQDAQEGDDWVNLFSQDTPTAGSSAL